MAEGEQAQSVGGPPALLSNLAISGSLARRATVTACAVCINVGCCMQDCPLSSYSCPWGLLPISLPRLRHTLALIPLHPQALEIFEGMERQGLPRDAITYSAAISALAKGKQWHAAMLIFDHMQARLRQACSWGVALECVASWGHRSELCRASIQAVRAAPHPAFVQPCIPYPASRLQASNIEADVVTCCRWG